MIVIIRFEIDDDRRRALRHSWGQKGLATRKEVANEVAGIAEIYFDDKLVDMKNAIAAEAEAR